MTTRYIEGGDAPAPRGAHNSTENTQNTQPYFKMGEGPGETFLSRRHTGGLQVHEEVLMETMRSHRRQSSGRREVPRGGEDVEKREPSRTAVGSQLVQPLWRTARRFLKKLRQELPRAPVIPLLGIYAKERKTGY